MAEIRIPTDRIPADILQRLQAIGHSIIFPGHTATPSTAATTAAAATVTAATVLPTAQPTSATKETPSDGQTARTSFGYAQSLLADGVMSSQGAGSSHVEGRSLFSTSATDQELLAISSRMTTASPSTPLSSLSSFPSTSSSPPLLAPYSSPPDQPAEKAPSFTSLVERTPQFSPHRRSVPSTSDEMDGQAVTASADRASIVHVLDLNKHRKRAGHPIDESDIVRIFPLEAEEECGTQEEPDNMQNAVSEIVRIFPEVEQQHGPQGQGQSFEGQDSAGAKAHRIFSSPTKNLTSAASPRHRLRHNARSTKPTDGGSTTINTAASSTTTTTTTTTTTNNNFTQNVHPAHPQSHHHHHRQQQCVQPSSRVPNASMNPPVPHIFSQPPVFTLSHEEDDDDEDFPDEDSHAFNTTAITPTTTPVKNKFPASSEATPAKHRPAHTTISHLSAQKLGHNFGSPTNSARLTPPVSAIARRSPGGLVTPPMTPDEMGEDEVFSYDNTKDDSVSLSVRHAFNSYRHTIECTPRRGSSSPLSLPLSNQRRHSDLSVEHRQLRHAHNPGSAPPKSSPFSPAQRLSELSFGDRQHTRKRLSFEECAEEKSSPTRPVDIYNGEWTTRAVDSTARTLPLPARQDQLDRHTIISHQSEPSLTHCDRQYFSDAINSDNSRSSSAAQSPQHFKLHPNSAHNYRPRPSKSVSPSLPSSIKCDDSKSNSNKYNNNINNNNNNGDDRNNYHTLYNSRSSPSFKSQNTTDSPLPPIASQSHAATLHGYGHFPPQAPPPSPAQPITGYHNESPVLHPSHMTHIISPMPSRSRLYSEGNDVTTNSAAQAQCRLRVQAFSHGKRRRLDTHEPVERRGMVASHSRSQQASPSPPLSPTAHQSTEYSQISGVSHSLFHQETEHGRCHQLQQDHKQQQQQQQQHYYQQQQQHYHQQQQQQHEQLPSQQQHHYPEPQTAQTAHVSQLTSHAPCACATIERDFLQVAEYAYKRIRRLDNTPGDFDRFRREMAQTNDMLKEWLLIMGNIRNICGHSPSSSCSSQTTTSTTVSAPAMASSSFSSSFSSTIPMAASASSSLPLSVTHTSTLNPSSSSSSPCPSYSLGAMFSQASPCVSSLSDSTSSTTPQHPQQFPPNFSSTLQKKMTTPSATTSTKNESNVDG